MSSSRSPSTVNRQLLLDTSSNNGIVAISDGGKILISEENEQSKDHAAWLHDAVQRVMEKAGVSMQDLKAVAVVAGPGSYTGLRVSLAAAKGFCYALNIPLICINTLELMARALQPEAKTLSALICPMIDARRDEVFTALYNADLREIMKPQPLILDKMSFEHFLRDGQIIFSGSGAEKWRRITNTHHAIFLAQPILKETLAIMAQAAFERKDWAGLIEAEPVYLKEFYTHSKN